MSELINSSSSSSVTTSNKAKNLALLMVSRRFISLEDFEMLKGLIEEFDTDSFKEVLEASKSNFAAEQQDLKEAMPVIVNEEDEKVEAVKVFDKLTIRTWADGTPLYGKYNVLKETKYNATLAGSCYFVNMNLGGAKPLPTMVHTMDFIVEDNDLLFSGGVLGIAIPFEVRLESTVQDDGSIIESYRAFPLNS